MNFVLFFFYLFFLYHCPSVFVSLSVNVSVCCTGCQFLYHCPSLCQCIVLSLTSLQCQIFSYMYLEYHDKSIISVMLNTLGLQQSVLFLSLVQIGLSQYEFQGNLLIKKNFVRIYDTGQQFKKFLSVTVYNFICCKISMHLKQQRTHVLSKVCPLQISIL